MLTPTPKFVIMGETIFDQQLFSRANTNNHGHFPRKYLGSQIRIRGDVGDFSGVNPQTLKSIFWVHLKKRVLYN